MRRADKPVVLLANKAEGNVGLSGAYEAFGLGLGDPVPVSAEHGEGLGQLHDALAEVLPEPERDDDGEDAEGRALKVAIVGRPNAGKSTLINRMLGEDRLLVGPEAGITRDSISLDWEWRGRRIKLHDTAGCAGAPGSTTSSRSSRSPTGCGRCASPRWWWCSSTPRSRSRSRTSPSSTSSSRRAAPW